MKLPMFAVGLISAVLMSGCSSQSPAANVDAISASPSAAVSIAYEDMPPVAESDVTIDCSTYADGAKAFVRQESDLVVNEVQYRVATVACGLLGSEVSAEVVESFVADNGAWASNGIVSGPDVPFNTSGPCESDNDVVKCPAFVLSEEGEAVGYIEIMGQDNGLVWTFIAE
ncbi:unannotated protein [freshwater metagenome]|uniref:Unannotated protein n=1 Tax=freshwater metagenome TaxID=449393 RepID=A0A6J5ZRW1_9ZZZZ|nr:hypothetical protein [Actinomycetota bacterium]MSW25434.1 hypothetical protein [Actinomycetota bacterium]MSX30082.1 hypothetical protein [Actinomycetota bacterium]MSX43535.1 hypothetical protein [Actinomycetota bacterium]MSX97756.1 hypothetical protein [Actinomycetota bacterium]